MAIPWLLALRAIPWGTIVANTPSILRSADALRAGARPRSDTVAPDDLKALRDRVAALEQRDRESAEVLTQLTAQVAALTAAAEVLQARVRWLVVLAIGALALSVVTGGIALVAGR